jgi:hypothetical protein
VRNSCLLGISTKGDHSLPDASPTLDDGGQLFPPRTFGKILKPLGCQLRRLGFIALLEFPGNRLALLPVAEAPGIADQVHDAGLNFGLGKNRRNTRFFFWIENARIPL